MPVYERRNGHNAGVFFHSETNRSHSLLSLSIEPGTVITVPSKSQPGFVYDIRFLQPDENVPSPGNRYIYCVQTFPYDPLAVNGQRREYSVWLPIDDLFAMPEVQALEGMQVHIHEGGDSKQKSDWRNTVTSVLRGVLQYANQSSW